MALVGHSLIQQHRFWEIYDGKTARFWEDAWQQLPPLERPGRYPKLQEACISRNLCKVADLWGLQLPGSFSRPWVNQSWLECLGPSQECVWLKDELTMRCIHRHEGNDKLRWGYGLKGVFSLK